MSVTSVHPEHENDAAWNELRPVLHDEVNRLPEKYRLPVILSYLEGKSNEEVARVLDWPVGTVKGRLSRARELLRSRLTRRGMALSAAFLCTALSRGESFAETVPASLIDHTLHAAMQARRKMAGAVGSADPLAPAEPELDLLDRPRFPWLIELCLEDQARDGQGIPWLGFNDRHRGRVAGLRRKLTVWRQSFVPGRFQEHNQFSSPQSVVVRLPLTP